MKDLMPFHLSPPQSGREISQKPFAHLSPEPAWAENPEGVPDISPGLRRDAGRYPGKTVPIISSNPEGVEECLAIPNHAYGGRRGEIFWKATMRIEPLNHSSG